jgi:hypothetical protein
MWLYLWLGYWAWTIFIEKPLTLIDIDGVNRVIEEIRIQNPSLADTFVQVAKDLQFGQILHLIYTNHSEFEPNNTVGENE